MTSEDIGANARTLAQRKPNAAGDRRGETDVSTWRPGLSALEAGDQDRIDRAMQWLMRLPRLQPSELPEAAKVEATVAALCKPCNPTWCLARVAALLNPYYDKDTPNAVRKMEAEDWIEEVGPYPQWAIERAVRWWKSSENPDRRKKPLEGDISARCRVEMRGVSALPDLIERKRSGRYIEPEDPRPKMSAEDRRAIADRVMAQAGFRPKTFGG
jgi:hypothetical protein